MLLIALIGGVGIAREAPTLAGAAGSQAVVEAAQAGERLAGSGERSAGGDERLTSGCDHRGANACEPPAIHAQTVSGEAPDVMGLAFVDASPIRREGVDPFAEPDPPRIA